MWVKLISAKSQISWNLNISLCSNFTFLLFEFPLSLFNIVVLKLCLCLGTTIGYDKEKIVICLQTSVQDSAESRTGYFSW